MDIKKQDLLKAILKLGEELDKNHGMGGVLIIDEMGRLLDNYVDNCRSLPSDSEIEDYVNEAKHPFVELWGQKKCFTEGAKWMRSYLQKNPH